MRAEEPSITADRLELYFQADATDDIWKVTRAAASETWGAPEEVLELNTSSSEAAPSVSADGLTIYFASVRPGGIGGRDIWVSTRSSRTDRWSAPTPVAELNTPDAETSAVVDQSGLWLTVSRRVGGNSDIYVSRRLRRTDLWYPPVPISELNTPDVESSPYLGARHLRIAFHSVRPGAAGRRDLWEAVRSDVTSSFATPLPLAALNTSAHDTDPFLTPDMCHIVFKSDRDGGSGRIYESSRCP